jgi:hypothetical protein
MCCVVVCDLETSRIGAPHIYDISHLRVKTMSYAHCRHSFFEKFGILKMNITRAIEEVNERTVTKVARNMVKRVDKCIEMNGHYF